MIDQGKEFIRQKIEEMLKAHETHHLKKKFKRDIEKLEVFKVQFCDIYKNVCVLEGKEEETKLDLRNFEMNIPIQKEVHFVKITPTPTPHENSKRGMKESVPKDIKKKLNISTIEQGDINRPLTPVRIPPKNLKIAEKKNDYSTTPNKTNNLTITQIKLPEVKKDFEKSAKTERKEPSRQIKEEHVVKHKKEDISEPKKENKVKEDKKAKTESMEKLSNEEKRKEKSDRQEESKHKEEKLVKKSDSIKQVKFNEEKRKSSSVVPENRNEFEKRASQDLNLNKDLKEEKRPSIKDKPAENKRKSIESNKVVESTPIKTTTADNKRTSINKPADTRSIKTPEPAVDQRATTPNQIKRSSVSKTAETTKSQDPLVSQIQETKVEAPPDPKPIVIVKEEPKVEPKTEPVSIPTPVQQVEEHIPPKESIKPIETATKATIVQLDNNESQSQPVKVPESVQEQPPVTVEQNEGEAKKNISSAIDKVETIQQNNAELAQTTITNTQVPEAKQEINPPNKTVGKKLKLNKLAEMDLSPNSNKALVLMAYKNYLPFQKRIELLLKLRNVSLLKADILKDMLNYYEERVKAQQIIITKFEKDFMVDNQVNKVFAPSKTATNGLNFITKEEEANLIKKEQPIEIQNVFKCLYLVIGESYDGIPANKLIETLLTTIFPKRKIENLKFLFLTTFPQSLGVFQQWQYERLIKLQQENPRLLNSSDLLKLSRSVSYMTFVLKEVFDYLNIKTSDGTQVYLLRTARKTNPLLKEKIDRLQILINNI